MTTQRASVRADTTPHIEAVIDVGGDFSGQIAVGDNIVQLKNVQIQVQPGGALIAAPTGPVHVRRRPGPVRARGRRPRVFVDRAAERATAGQAAADHDVLGFTGPPGSGKSALLRELAHELTEDSKDREVVLVAGAGRPTDDVLNDAFQLLFETDRPYVAVGAALRAHLQDFEGVVLVDDAIPDPRHVTDLLDTFPESAVILSAPALPSDVRSMELASLSQADRRALAGLLGAGTGAIAAAPSGLPGELVLAARAASVGAEQAAQLEPMQPQRTRTNVAPLPCWRPPDPRDCRERCWRAAGTDDVVDRLTSRGAAEEDKEDGVKVIRLPAVVAAAWDEAPGDVDGLRRLLGAIASRSAEAGDRRRPTSQPVPAPCWPGRATASGLRWLRPVRLSRPSCSSAAAGTSGHKSCRPSRPQLGSEEDRGLEAHALHQLGTWAFCTRRRGECPCMAGAGVRHPPFHR